MSPDYSLKKAIDQSGFELRGILNSIDIGFLMNYRNLLNEQRLNDLINKMQNNPDKYANGNWYKASVIEVFKSKNSKPPAMHCIDDCQYMLSNYEGFGIPDEIYERSKKSPDLLKKYFDWTRQPEIEDLVSSGNMEKFYELQNLEFNTKGKLTAFTMDNSGVASAFVLPELEKMILNTLEGADNFRNQSEEHQKLIKQKGYGTNRKYVRESHSILSEWYNQYQKRIMELIQQLYRQTENPILVFDGNLLESCGFQKCKGCCR